MIEPATFNALRRFRARVYQRFGARRDALFELLDAATVAGLVPSLVHLSLAAVHRRRWGSLYDALAAGRMDTAALRELLARYPLDDGQPIYALDTSVWPRDDAETSPGRGHYFSSSRQSAGQPIVTRWMCSACQLVVMPTRSPRRRSANCWSICPPTDQSRCASSTPATTP
jgi:hypothetical protein